MANVTQHLRRPPPSPPPHQGADGGDGGGGCGLASSPAPRHRHVPEDDRHGGGGGGGRHGRRRSRVAIGAATATAVLVLAAGRNLASQRRQLEAVRVASGGAPRAAARSSGGGISDHQAVSERADQGLLQLASATDYWAANASSSVEKTGQEETGKTVRRKRSKSNVQAAKRKNRRPTPLSSSSSSTSTGRSIDMNPLVPGDTLLLEDLEPANGTTGAIESNYPTPRLGGDCGCPGVCDAVGLSRRVANGLDPLAWSCASRIRLHLETKTNKTTKADAESGAQMAGACSAAALEGSCGPECDPQRCRGVREGSEATSATATPLLNWTRVSKMEIPPEPFQKHEGRVVVATKVHSAMDLQRLQQMICLFTAAYNRHLNYDIVVFTTIPWRRWHLQELRAVAPQTHIRVVRDSVPLRDHFALMKPRELKFLVRRCGAASLQNLTWSNNCGEPGYPHETSLGYAWQAEFRSYHIWKTAVLAPYSYMMWIDADSYCTGPWTSDPVQEMVDQDLVLLADNFPAGHARNPRLNDKLRSVYNRTLCSLSLEADGFVPKECDESNTPQVGLVHGMMHVTSLNFYRSPKNLRYLELHAGDHRFSREWDDQLAVTAPAALGAPGRVRDLRTSGHRLGVHHNGYLDGKEWNEKYGVMFWEYWTHDIRNRWEVGREMCDALVLFHD